MKIPPHYNRLMPYMILPNAYRYVEFMKNVFGATAPAFSMAHHVQRNMSGTYDGASATI